ncbi:uncharacterized protein TNIN_500571 [Trichonephila inaurata madagascariensis]|uniref:Uncharacterized protein n=1 Tax=Trichonephila inaurata madagascariensis TaxID=2747483 RepID=A0A8X6K283_9ARAC|nr:uncharacterized protein TNIN_500571 [Trichonephila inaurata madagascariensis]
MEGEYATSSNTLSNTWTLARMASVGQEVTWTFTNGFPSISFGDNVLTATYRNKILNKFHQNFKMCETEKLLDQHSPGKLWNVFTLQPESGYFITGGLYTCFADWRFVHKVRLNVTPLNGCKPWISGRQRKCRKCGRWDKTLPHMLNHCPSYSAAWQMRHKEIVCCIKTAVAYKGIILSRESGSWSDYFKTGPCCYGWKLPVHH